jgi:hypothetical protein
MTRRSIARDASQLGQGFERSIQPIAMGGKRAVHRTMSCPLPAVTAWRERSAPSLDRPFLAAIRLLDGMAFVRAAAATAAARQARQPMRFPPAERCFRLRHHPRVHSRTIRKVELVHSTALYTGTLSGFIKHLSGSEQDAATNAHLIKRRLPPYYLRLHNTLAPQRAPRVCLRPRRRWSATKQQK